MKINNIPVNFFKFPGGEIQVNLSEVFNGYNFFEIECSLINSDEIMKLLLVVNAIKKLAISPAIYLTIYYLPYCRQDRVCQYGEALSVQVICELINSLKCVRVSIFDPHSDVCVSLLDNVCVHTMKEILVSNEFDFSGLTIVCPDVGAIKKISSITDDYVLAIKKRNVSNGHVYIESIHGDVCGKDVIILDDICDGGATFINLSIELKTRGAKSVYLYVTHGIFSKGLDILRPHFNRIYCLHSFEQYEEEFICYVSA